MTGPPGRLEQLGGRLDAYCQAKKYQLRADAWVGLGTVAGQSGPFQFYVFGRFPWEQDATLEQLVRDMGLSEEPPLPAGGQDSSQ